MNIGIIGCGAYAIALASILENKKYNITMWTKLENEYEELKNNHTNLKVLDYKLDKKIKFTTSLEELSNTCDYFILAIPAKFIKSTINELKPFYKEQDILIATKGVESTTEELIHDYLKKELKTNKIACISGPSFAKDIVKREPLGLTLASLNPDTLKVFTKMFKNISYLTIETKKDIVGCELCGILKNIIAIVSGMLAGMELTNSTRSKFLVDSSLEIQKIIKKFGGNKTTFYTYAGIGDLNLTCSSTDSRNYTFGYLIGSEKDYKTYKENTTVEGIENLETVYKMLKEKKIKSNVINTLYKIVYLDESKELILKYLKKEK